MFDEKGPFQGLSRGDPSLRPPLPWRTRGTEATRGRRSTGAVGPTCKRHRNKVARVQRANGLSPTQKVSDRTIRIERLGLKVTIGSSDCTRDLGRLDLDPTVHKERRFGAARMFSVNVDGLIQIQRLRLGCC